MSSPTDNPIMTRQLVPLDVREILDFLVRRWKLVCAIAALTFATFVIAAYKIPPSYTAVGQVLLDAPNDYMTPQDYSNSDFADNSTFIESQIAVLRSTSLLQKIVDSEKLTDLRTSLSFP